MTAMKPAASRHLALVKMDTAVLQSSVAPRDAKVGYAKQNGVSQLPPAGPARSLRIGLEWLGRAAREAKREWFAFKFSIARFDRTYVALARTAFKRSVGHAQVRRLRLFENTVDSPPNSCRLTQR